MSTTVSLFLEPLDVLFFRDGKPFGATSRVVSGQPFPQTLMGALWTAFLTKYGCDFDKLTSLAGSQDKEKSTDEASPGPRKPLQELFVEAGAPSWITRLQLRGPFLAKRTDEKAAPQIYLPVPSIIHSIKTKSVSAGAKSGALRQFYRLAPLSRQRRLPGWPAPDGLRPLWLTSKVPTEPVEGFLDLDGTKLILTNQDLDAQLRIFAPRELFLHDYRVGIGINPETLIATGSLIYEIGLLQLAPSLGYYAEVILPQDAPQDALAGINTLHFGGEGRRVRLVSVPQVNWPQALPQGDSQKPFLLLTTPAVFQQGYKPRVLSGYLVAASVSGYQAVSGWDLARGGPKPTRFAVPAGSVYFLENLPPELPAALADEPNERGQGWGCYLIGVWNDV
ncbi:MAG: type III-B CRISPR module-associated Cmr3 family protein [Gemmatales bacterium]|nr:type III-B CRISPR module-associated Cmr3 family protein [Gemmatales bacterium]